jgi:cell division protein FtsL
MERNQIMLFKFGEIMYESIMNLTTLEKILAFICFLLLTITVSFTIIDYKSKAKHINKKRW